LLKWVYWDFFVDKNIKYCVGWVGISPSVLEELLPVVGVFGWGYVDDVASAERHHGLDQ